MLDLMDNTPNEVVPVIDNVREFIIQKLFAALLS